MSMTVMCVAPDGAWAVATADRRTTCKVAGEVVSRTDGEPKQLRFPGGLLVCCGDRRHGDAIRESVQQRQPQRLGELQAAIRGALDGVHATGYVSEHPGVCVIAAAVWDAIDERFRGWLFDPITGTPSPAPSVIALPELDQSDQHRIEQFIESRRHAGRLDVTVAAIRRAFAVVRERSDAVSAEYDLVSEDAHARIN